MVETAHSKIGASGAYRWMPCPGSIRESAKAPRQEQSPAAAEGEAAHQLAEKCLINHHDAEEYIGETIYDHEVTGEMADAVQVYLDTVRADIEDYIELGVQPIFGIESGFNLEHIHPDMFGTNDAFVGEPFNKLTIYDYKHGKGSFVDVVDNSQLKYYGLGGLKDADYDEVELVIVQPRCPSTQGVVRRWTISAEELIEWGNTTLKEAAYATEDPDAPLQAGKHCFFCPAKGKCPALRKQATELAYAEFSDLEDPTPIKLPAAEDMTPEQLSKLLASADILDSWIKGVHSYVESAFLKGDIEMPEFKAVRKGTKRKWESSDKVEKKLKKLFKEEAYAAPKLITITEAERKLGKEKGKLADIIEKPIGALIMVHESDNRKAVSVQPMQQALEEFKDLTD